MPVQRATPKVHSEVMESLRDSAADLTSPLSERDRQFATDLLRQWDSRGYLSEKQIYWVNVLNEKASDSTTGTMAPKKVEHPTIDIGNISRVLEMFRKAQSKKDIPYPVIKLPLIINDKVVKTMRLTPSKTMDAVNINDDKEQDQQGRRVWHGGIKQADGKLHISTRYPLSEEAVKLLREFVANPDEVSNVIGKRLKWCCFCGTKLSAKISLHYGYGPICASNFGLEWSQSGVEEEELEEMGESIAAALKAKGVQL